MTGDQYGGFHNITITGYKLALDFAAISPTQSALYFHKIMINGLFGLNSKF